MRNPLPLLAAVLASSAIGAQSVRPDVVMVGDLSIRNVSVVDVVTGRVVPSQSVLVQGGRIVAVDRTQHAARRVIDGRGLYLIPGLWDMHGHFSSSGEEAMAECLKYGVTVVRDVGGALEQVGHWQAEIRSRRRIGPEILRCGPFIDGPKNASHRLVVQTAEEAVGAVRALSQSRVDGIKIHNGINREALLAAAGEARRLRLPVACHLTDSVPMAVAARSGVSTFEHGETILENLMGEDPGLTVLDAIPVATGVRGREIFAVLAKERVAFTPTLVAYRSFLLDAKNEPDRIGRQTVMDGLMRMVGMMNEQGVRIVAGTDFSEPSWPLFPGKDLHLELELLVQSGLTPLEALRSATVSPAAVMRRTQDYGTVEVGKAASFVLLRANPLTNISNTRQIEWVVHDGKVVSGSLGS